MQFLKIKTPGKLHFGSSQKRIINLVIPNTEVKKRQTMEDRPTKLLDSLQLPTLSFLESKHTVRTPINSIPSIFKQCMLKEISGSINELCR